MVKIVIEIIEDRANIGYDLLELKTAIRDGSSLLYDLLPSYLSLNMGHSGLATKNNISKCHLVSKQGRQINGVDFVVNLLRSTVNPYCFIVVILNLETGEEHSLELDEQDVQQLTEGDRGLLEDSEPIDLQNLIIDNLELIERDNIKFLTCTHRVFFNQLWHGIMSSKLSQTSQRSQPSKISAEYEIRVRNDVEETQINPHFTKTTLRDETLLKNAPFSRLDERQHYKKLLLTDAACQTDFEGSVLYDSMVTVFRGHNQLNQEIRIDMEAQQSQHENLITLVFRDPRTHNSAKFCVFNRMPNHHLTSFANTENSRDAADAASNADQVQSSKIDFESRVSATSGGQQPNSQYIIHSEVIQVGKEHMVMVCVERI